MAVDLDDQYQKIIDDQRAHLLEMQEEFNELCESEKKKAQGRLAKLDKSDREGREQVLQEQKATLDEALAKLKSDVAESTRQTMKALEDIIRQKERMILADLEKQLAAL